MKAALWLVPAVLAAGMGYWLYSSNQTVDKLKTELVQTRKQLQDARAPVAGGGEETSTKARGKQGAPVLAAKDSKINWRAMSALLAEMTEGGDGAHIEQMLQSFHDRLGSMNASDMHSALDEIAGLGLPVEKQSELEAMVVESLMSKDPEGVLARFDDRIGEDDDDVGWILSEALGHFADKDPVAAARWMDEKIKSGKFESKSLDGYSEARVEYESVLMARMLSAQGAQAMDRIRALPEGDRLAVLEQMDLTGLDPQAQSVYADILRTLVPESDREGAFGYVASELVYDGGFDAVDSFLEQAKASPAERLEVAEDAATGRLQAIAEEGKPSLANIEEMRAWLQRNAPDQMDRITGMAIGEAYDSEGYLNYEDAQKLVLSYHDRSGKDDILAGFIQSFAGQENLEEAKKLLNQIRDPELRMKLMREMEE